ncbi:hypothetical protein GCM10027162_55690 [Streptomyces incanus]
MRSSDCASLVRVVAVPEPDPAPPPAAGRGPADQADTAAPCRVNRLAVNAEAGTGFSGEGDQFGIAQAGRRADRRVQRHQVGMLVA